MVDALNLNKILTIEGAKRINIKINDIPKILEKGISYFISGKTKEFFTRFDVSPDFLKNDPSTWKHNNLCLNGCDWSGHNKLLMMWKKEQLN